MLRKLRKIKMNKIILFILLILVIPLVFAGSVTRSFSSDSVEVDEEINVSLIINVNDTDNVYAIGEILPSGYELVDNGGGSLANDKLRWLKYSNIEDRTYTYKVKFSSSGAYNFAGVYAFNDEGERTIGGDNEISVSSADGNGNGGRNGNGGGGCTPSWTCTSWGSCANNVKTRTCTDYNNCGSLVGKPAESEICVCSSDWQCGQWQPEKCPKSETQKRACIDTNNCGILSGKPQETKTCTYEPQTGWIFIIIVIILVLAILIVVIVLSRVLNKRLKEKRVVEIKGRQIIR